MNPLQESFGKGAVPKNLDGFYTGKLLQLLPTNPLEQFGNLITKIWLPWYGKEFTSKSRSGNNLLPSYLLPLIRWRCGSEAIVGRDDSGIHVFPFKTSVTLGLKDQRKVLQLNYDSPENPDRVRDVIDEVVEVDKNKYLGKAYLKEGKDYRLVAYFGLEK